MHDGGRMNDVHGCVYEDEEYLTLPALCNSHRSVLLPDAGHPAPPNDAAGDDALGRSATAAQASAEASRLRPSFNTCGKSVHAETQSKPRLRTKNPRYEQT